MLQDGVSLNSAESVEISIAGFILSNKFSSKYSERQDLGLPPVHVGLDVLEVSRLFKTDDLEHELHTP